MLRSYGSLILMFGTRVLHLLSLYSTNAPVRTGILIYGHNSNISAPEGDWMPWSREDSIRGKDAHYWFHVSFTAPPEKPGHRLFFRLETGCNSVWDAVGPQGLLYLNGEMVQGLDVNRCCIILQRRRRTVWPRPG